MPRRPALALLVLCLLPIAACRCPESSGPAKLRSVMGLSETADLGVAIDDFHGGVALGVSWSLLDSDD